jgi:hypothetical protein
MEATVSATPVNDAKPLNKLGLSMQKDANDSRTNAHESTEGVPESERRHIATAEIPKDQRFAFRITPLPGRLLDLRTIGNSMAAMAKFHSALGDDIDPKIKWKSCITGCELEADGSFRVDIAVLPMEKAHD